MEESKKEALKLWLKQPQNLILIAILIFAFAIRLHYFFMTSSQPLWWDEACYGSLAKNLALGGPWSDTGLIQKESFIRPMFLPLLWAILYKIGIQEPGVRFLLQFLPSIISVLFVYLITKEMYGKNTALISTFIFSTIWVHLFYTARLLTNVPATAFLLASIYFFIRSQKKEFNAKYFGISIFLLSISTLTRYPVGIIFFVYLAFILVIKRTSLLKNKKFWIAGIIGLLPILIFFLINYLNYGNIFPALLSGEYYGKDTGKPRAPIAFNLLNFIPNFLGKPGCTFDNLLCYLKIPFFLLFIIGSLIILSETILGYDLIRKKRRITSHLLIILLFVFFYAFFIFSVRAAEDRYFLPISITFASIAGFGANSAYKFAKKYSKQIALILLLGILAFGAYQEIKFADEIIKNKKESFLYERKGFEWIEDNTPEDSVTIGRGTGPYSIYYAERYYLDAPENASDLEKTEADYFVFNAYRPDREDILSYIQENQNKWQPINAFFFDNQKQQPAFIVFKNL